MELVPLRTPAAVVVLWLRLLLWLTAVAADGPDGQECGAASGGQWCSLNTCCSGGDYCGTTAAYCGAGCQAGFGSCVVPTAPSCPAGGHSASRGRRVGYYQVAQAWQRPCERVTPAHIDTAGLTHLLLAFAHFDAATFAVGPANPQDAAFYRPFTARQGPALQTWISVGGGGFSAAAWRAMLASAANRAAFAASLHAFVRRYRFQGVDLDFEFPAADGSDSDHLVALVATLRAVLGPAAGLSLTLPSDWGSVRGFDPAALGAHVDFFNYMAYDQHGWGVDAGPAQAVVAYPADIRLVATEIMPLWANHTHPRQVNLGIPYYGRGYTLANASCTRIGCAATGPSQPGPCTGDPSGVLSLDEIQHIPNKSVSIDAAAMQKVAVWNATQWIAYDDAQTIALKAAWADKSCLGGLMFWSVDFL